MQKLVVRPQEGVKSLVKRAKSRVEPNLKADLETRLSNFETLSKEELLTILISFFDLEIKND